VTILGGANDCTVAKGDVGPSVSSTAPNSAANTGTIHILGLAGSDFRLGASVKLVKAGQPVIHASNVSVENASKIKCDSDVNGAGTDRWSLW
jgi:hypothetical protein